MADYGYANARVRVMKSELLARIFVEQLLDEDELNQVISALEQTVYKQDIEQGLLKHPGAPGVEEGLRQNIVRSFRKLLRITEGEVHELLEILLGRWDVHNLKTILRGKHVGGSSQDMLESLVAAGELDEALLSELVKQKDMKGCIDMLALWKIPYYIPLMEHWQDYVRNNSLVALELALDKFYYTHALEKLSGAFLGMQSLSYGLVREVLRREVDFINLMTLMRLPRGQMEAEEIEEFLIDGGKELPLEVLAKVLKAPEVEDIVKQVEHTSYRALFHTGLAEYFEKGALSALERQMEEMVIRRSVSMFKTDPLSIGLIIGYIWAKFNEVVNLRVIVRGKEVGMPQDRIKEALVLV